MMLTDVRRGVVMMEPVAREVTGGQVLSSEPTQPPTTPVRRSALHLLLLGDLPAVTVVPLTLLHVMGAL
jgi:hypothetical protein